MIDILPDWAALLVAVLLVTGGLVTLVGALGLLRLSHFYARMHAPTMGTTLGLGCVLLASMLAASIQGQRLMIQELLITILVVATSPVTAVLLMQAGIERDPDLAHPAEPFPPEDT